MMTKLDNYTGQITVEILLFLTFRESHCVDPGVVCDVATIVHETLWSISVQECCM